MIPIVFFGLWSLGPLTVMGIKRSWLPTTVPWPADQCVNAGRGFVGECIIDPNSSREGLFYLDNPTCEKLKCALPRPEGGYSLVKLGPPVDGTFCGILQVCRNGNCIDIDPDEIPTATGIKTTYKCDPPIVVRKPIINRNFIEEKKKTKTKATTPRKREM